MKTKKISSVLFFLIFIWFIFIAFAYDLPKWFPFNKENALQEWQEKIFKDRVLYVVEPNKDGGFLSAKSETACSGLLYRIKFDANKLPMMSWAWKVVSFPKKEGDQSLHKGGWVERDDYAARVYVIFPSWNFMRTKCIEYIWDENLAEGQVLSSPFSDNIKLIVAESGNKNLDQWIMEERNIAEDYKIAFGVEQVPYVGAIALMTDSDNTLSTAEAYYKDLKVGYAK